MATVLTAELDLRSVHLINDLEAIAGAISVVRGVLSTGGLYLAGGIPQRIPRLGARGFPQRDRHPG